ncbi:MAG: M24 family metallopeptidase [Dongiaceae bacterium]
MNQQTGAVKVDRAKLEPASEWRPFPLEEYEARWQRVHDMMKQKGLELLVIWGKTSGVYERAGDMLYLANFFSTHSGQEPDTVLWNGRSYSALIMQPGQVPELVTDEAEGRFDIIATDRFSGLYDPIKGVADAVKKRKVQGKIGFVGTDTLPMKYWEQLKGYLPNANWLFDDDLIRNVRLVKSRLELELFREAGELVTKAHIAMMEALVSGKKESEAAGAAGKILLEGGGNWHRMAISHGAASDYLESDPLTGFSTKTPKKGDIVHGFIYGPILKGYWLDPGRTAVCGGKPTTEQKKLIETLVDVMRKLMAEIKPGVKVKKVGELGDKLTEESGYFNEVLKTNWPYYGHSNGCMWEAPYIEPRLCTDDDIFLEDMVASVEAFYTAEGVGTAAFETNFIITRNGCDEITKTPHLFW